MTSAGAMSVAEIREHLTALAAGSKTLDRSIVQCFTGELAEFLGELAELRALAGAATAIVTAEAESRGVVDESQCASTRAWVSEHAWHSRREAVSIAKAAHILRRPDLAELTYSIRTADLDLPTAVVVQSEFDKLAPDLLPGSEPIVLREMADFGADHGPSGVRQLRQYLLATHGKPDEFADFQDRCRRSIALSHPVETSPGVHEYRVVLDNESMSTLEAAIQTRSAPRPDPDTGQHDTRPTDRRRGEALIEALRRSVEAAAHGATAAVTAMLTVTMNLDDLQHQTGAATCTGTIADGTLLAPDTARKIACDAGNIPTVLGSDGAVFDRGREQRLFTLTQKRPSGIGISAAPSPGATPPHSGPTPTTWCTGSTADPPTSRTPPCSADGTTPSSTATTCTAKSLQDRSSGTENQDPTNPPSTDRRPQPARR